MTAADRESAVAETLAEHEFRPIRVLRGRLHASCPCGWLWDTDHGTERAWRDHVAAAVLAALDTAPPSLAEVDHQLTAYLSDPHGSEWRITQAAAVVREIRAGGESDG